MARITNRAELLSHGMSELREAALFTIEAGLEAIDPAAAVAGLVSFDGRHLAVDDRRYDVSACRRVLVLGAGKASLRIAQALEALIGDRIDGGWVVVPEGQHGRLRRIGVMEASHPIPDGRSLEAAHRLLKAADDAAPQDLVIACITGGSSALVSLPPNGVPVEDKRDLHRLLLSSGVTIEEINAVRKHVSEIKGGRLAARIAPAPILNLTVSDVAGDSADLITDLTVQDTSTVEDAVGVLRTYGLWDSVAPSIQSHLLDSEAARSPDLRRLDIETAILATGDTACDAMASRARDLGFAPVVLTTLLEGESREVGRVLGSLAGESARKGRPFAPPSLLVGCGSETTVTLQGERFGMGGPNQELAVGFALRIAPPDRVAAVFLDTDGHDGGTEAAGAVVDALTSSRAGPLGLDLRQALWSHRTGLALERLGDLVKTGWTGANLNDMLAIVLK